MVLENILDMRKTASTAGEISKYVFLFFFWEPQIKLLHLYCFLKVNLKIFLFCLALNPKDC